MVADMINNKKLNPVVSELLIRGRKLNISTVFITQSYCRTIFLFSFSAVFITQSYCKMIFLFSFLVKDTTLPSDNPLRFRKNLLR